MKNEFSPFLSPKSLKSLSSELRKKQLEIEEFSAKINEIKVECFAYQENILMIQDCNTQMIKEIDFRKSELTDKKKQYEALNANDLDEDYIGSIKEKDIKEQINKILNESIPLEPDK
jgi:hypothetical protein